MADRGMLNGISQYTRDACNFMNKVGLSKMRRYCKQFRPRMDFDKGLLLLRSVAQMGYTEASLKHNVSRQYAFQTVKHFYEIAKEAERWQEKL